MSQNEFKLDEEVQEELQGVMSEEEIIGMYQGGKSSEERVPLIEQFAPGEDEWGGKSIFREGQPREITLANNLAKAFPVLLPSEQFITSFIEEYEMRLTSVDGVARDQLMRIFRGMFGASTGEAGDSPGALQLALSAPPEDDD